VLERVPTASAAPVLPEGFGSQSAQDSSLRQEDAQQVEANPGTPRIEPHGVKQVPERAARFRLGKEVGCFPMEGRQGAIHLLADVSQ